MNVKLFSEIINVNYNQVRYMIQNGSFSFIKAVKTKKNYRYLFDPLETKKYILSLKEIDKKENEWRKINEHKF